MAQQKSVVVTFRVDPHLAEALERIPDKSAFIREALRGSLHETCPACGGTGRVDCEASQWLAKLLASKGARSCSCCGTAFPPSRAAAEDAPAGAARGTASKRGASSRRATESEPATCGHCGPEGHRH
jgi:hypothetical protein